MQNMMSFSGHKFITIIPKLYQKLTFAKIDISGQKV